MAEGEQENVGCCKLRVERVEENTEFRWLYFFFLLRLDGCSLTKEKKWSWTQDSTPGHLMDRITCTVQIRFKPTIESSTYKVGMCPEETSTNKLTEVWIPQAQHYQKILTAMLFFGQLGYHLLGYNNVPKISLFKMRWFYSRTFLVLSLFLLCLRKLLWFYWTCLLLHCVVQYVSLCFSLIPMGPNVAIYFCMLILCFYVISSHIVNLRPFHTTLIRVTISKWILWSFTYNNFHKIGTILCPHFTD